ncbi:MAG: GGDEF domain-containing protein [Candidatus Eremiobacteraeota bacterium]|nr:GGDEF domain-containing protein [Candidatus Eremiobacteraeota bacterium]
MESLGESKASQRSLWIALAVGGILAVVALCATPFMQLRLGDSPAAFTSFLTLAAFADALTAYLLMTQAVVGRSLLLLILAGGYLFSSLAIVVHALVFPGVASPTGLLGAGVQSATWFWVWWHGGFPLFVTAYAIARARSESSEHGAALLRRLVLGGCCAIASLGGGLTFFTVRYERLLPTIIEKGRFGLLVSTHVGPLVVLSIAIALFALVRFTRLRTITDLWLAVALFSSLLDCALTLASGGRYTVGWYAARLDSLAASMIVLLAFISAIGHMLTRLALLSHVDGLTGLANRRSFDEKLKAALVLAGRMKQPVALLMLDVDKFKTFNDNYGHQRGDEALQRVADCIRVALPRRSDLGARYGGEEFAAILPATGEADAVMIAERLRRLVVQMEVEHTGSAEGLLSVSIGISAVDGPAGDVDAMAEALIARADAALYRAKEFGRNRVMRASETRAESAVAKPKAMRTSELAIAGIESKREALA